MKKENNDIDITCIITKHPIVCLTQTLHTVQRKANNNGSLLQNSATWEMTTTHKTWGCLTIATTEMDPQNLDKLKKVWLMFGSGSLETPLIKYKHTTGNSGLLSVVTCKP